MVATAMHRAVIQDDEHGQVHRDLGAARPTPSAAPMVASHLHQGPALARLMWFDLRPRTNRFGW
jgi:hypothetical protein